jgi:uncharacterized membrane protein
MLSFLRAANGASPRRTIRPRLLLVAALVAACSGGDNPVVPTPPPPPPPPTPTPGTLAIALGSGSGSVVAGSQATTTVTITRGGSFTGDVSLAAEGAPAGVTASFSASSLPAGVTSASLTLQVAASTAAGTYPITVRATGSGVTAATATFTLTVTAAPVPTIALSAAPAAVSVAAGQAGTSTLTITRGGGFTGAVTLTASGAPAGVTVSFATSPATGGTATVTLTTAASTAAGNYPITIRGTATGVAEATATVTLTVTAPPRLELATTTPNVTITQGQQSAALPITITRENTTGAVALSATVPAGVTATVTPASTTGTSAQVVIAVGATVAPGTVPVVITGLLGGLSATVTFQVTVTAAATPDFGVSLAPASLTVTAGQAATTTVTVTRSGGFAGNVVFGTSALPTGVTATFTPGTVSGTTAQLQVQTTAGTPAGTYNVSVIGTGTGVGTRQVNLQLIVNPGGGGGGGGNVVWQFCADERFPIWFGFRDGTTGGWTRVLPGANQTYAFTISADRGAVTYVTDDNGADFDVTTILLSRAELIALGQSECVSNPARKTLTGTVAGLGAGQTATVNVGSGTANAALNGPFTVTDVADGVVDLLAARVTFDIPTFSNVADRLILRRNLNLPNNGAIPLLDFGAAEAFAPASASYTFGNAGSDQLLVISGFSTPNGLTGFFGFGPLTGGGATRTVYGVPLARTQAGDLHYVFATATAGPTIARSVAQYNRELTNRTLTLGPILQSPMVEVVAVAPYRRARASGTWQAEYNQGVGVTFTQTSGGGRSWSVTSSADYLGGATYLLEVPDLSGASGFNTTWGLLPGAGTEWAVSASKVENAPVGAAVEGFRFLTGSRTGSLP